jgi:hypothetical protein
MKRDLPSRPHRRGPAGEKGVRRRLGPDDGPSFWQRGQRWVRHDQADYGSMLSNMFAMGTQTLPPGGRLGLGFAAGEAVFFVYAGRGRAMVNQRAPDRPGDPDLRPGCATTLTTMVPLICPLPGGHPPGLDRPSATYACASQEPTCPRHLTRRATRASCTGAGLSRSTRHRLRLETACVSFQRFEK